MPANQEGTASEYSSSNFDLSPTIRPHDLLALARPARRRNLPASSDPSRKSGLKQWKMSARPRRLHAQSAGKMEKRRLFWGAHSNRAVQRPPSFLLSSQLAAKIINPSDACLGRARVSIRWATVSPYSPCCFQEFVRRLNTRIRETFV